MKIQLIRLQEENQINIFIICRALFKTKLESD